MLKKKKSKYQAIKNENRTRKNLLYFFGFFVLFFLVLIGSSLISASSSFNLFSKTNPSESYFSVNGTTGNVGFGMSTSPFTYHVDGPVFATQTINSTEDICIIQGSFPSITLSCLGNLSGSGDFFGSGTANYIPLRNSTNSLSDSQIYQSGSDLYISNRNFVLGPDGFFKINGIPVATITNGTDDHYANTLVGAYAGNSIKERQTAIGYMAGNSSTGRIQTAIGYMAGYNNTYYPDGFLSRGWYQTVVGYKAGLSNTGEFQTAVGHKAGYFNTESRQTAIGYQAGYLNKGKYQTAVGAYSGYNNSGDWYQTAIGYQAGYLNQGNNQIAIGYQAGYENQGKDNIFTGYRAGYKQDGLNNIFIGYNSGYLSEGSNNIFIGGLSGSTPGSSSVQEGDYNIFIGYNTGIRNKGNHVIGIGYPAGYYNTGNHSIFIGRYTGQYNSGNNVISLGHNSTYYNSFDNLVAIGYEANSPSDFGSNYFIVLNSEEHQFTLMNGNFSSGRMTSSTWATTSDVSFKENIMDLNYGLKEILLIRPREFNFKDRNEKKIGFIAQELEKIIPEIVLGEEQDKRVNYESISPVLTKAVQEIYYINNKKTSFYIEEPFYTEIKKSSNENWYIEYYKNNELKREWLDCDNKEIHHKKSCEKIKQNSIK